MAWVCLPVGTSGTLDGAVAMRVSYPEAEDFGAFTLATVHVRPCRRPAPASPARRPQPARHAGWCASLHVRLWRCGAFAPRPCVAVGHRVYFTVSGVEQLVARWVHTPEAEGSNPSPATTRRFAFPLHGASLMLVPVGTIA